MDMEEKNNLVTRLGKTYQKILINSVYGASGTDNYWYDYYKSIKRVEDRKSKIKKIFNDKHF